MKIFFKKSVMLFAFFAINFLSISAHATVWPVFSAPNKEQLMNKYIDTSSCPVGQGKLSSNIVISVDSLCTTYCPDSWVWLAKSDGACHDLATDFTFKNYEIQHYKDTNGTVRYSVVTASYGEKDSSKPSFQLTFTTPEEHWYCTVTNAETHTVSCANDI